MSWQAVLVVGAFQTADGGPFFAAPVVVVSNNGGAIASVAADLDGDGRAEFATTASTGGIDPHFRIMDLDVGSGTFVMHALIDASGRQDRFGGDLAVADIDGDGFPDIVVPESNTADGPGRVSWFRNPGGNLGGVWTENVISVWTGGAGDSVAHMSDVAVGDVNGDGWIDVVTRDISHGIFVLLRETGGGGWRPRRFVATNPREGLALADLDGDGDLDVVLNGVWLETPADPQAGVYQLHAYGAGWYPSSSGAIEIADYACQVETGDFNGDGRPDIAISNAEELNHGSPGKPTGIRVYLCPSDPTGLGWVEVVLEPQHYSWHSLELADFDGDGDLDVISGISDVGVDSAPPRIVLFLNGGNGASFTQAELDAGNYCYNASAGDADGDGDVDLLAPHHWNSGSIRFLKNLQPITNAPTPPPGLVAKGVSVSRIELSWGASSDDVAVTGYRVLMDGVEVGLVAGTTYAAEGLLPGSNHEFAVSALDGNGNESSASEVSAVTYTAVDDNAYLIAAWNLDEVESPSAAEVVADRNGILSGEPSWLPGGGRHQGALQYELTMDRVTVEAIDPPTAAVGITLMAWVKPSSFEGAAAEGRFISKAIGLLESEHDWALGNTGAGTALRFRLRTPNGGVGTLVSAEGILELGSWTHVAATHDGQIMRLYADGVEVAAAAKAGILVRDSGALIGLGNQPTGAGERAFNGLLDDVRIFSKALTPEEILAQSVSDGPSKFDLWKSWMAIPAATGANEDHDHDGMVMLVEYAFGLHPRHAEPLPVGISLSGNNSTVELRFPVVRSDVAYLIEDSHDLLSWSEADVIGVVDNGDGTLVASVSTSAPHFLRMRIVINSD